MFFQNKSFADILLFLLGLSIFLVFFLVIFGIIQSILIFIFSKGKNNIINKGFQSLKYIFFGFILLLITIFALTGIINLIKIPGYEKINTKTVFTEARDIFLDIVNIYEFNEKDKNSFYSL